MSERRLYQSVTTDNRRWDDFVARPDDIFVCTPPKCGTTWMQTIVASLLWPQGDAPDSVMTLSPWVEAKFLDWAEIRARYEAQTHRRFIKSHTPADGIPFFPEAKYLFVGRDGRDVFMSMCHHREVFRNDLRESLNVRALAEGVPPMPPWNGDVHGFFAGWLADAALLHHVASFWQHRRDPNVLFVHYADLKADLAGEMRRVAAFLDLEPPASLWPAVVERCTFEAMRARPAEIGSFWNFEGGAESFLFKGTNGRWRDVLSSEEVSAYARRVAELLPPDAADWLEHGSGEKTA